MLLHVSRLRDAAPAMGLVPWVPPAGSPCENQHTGLAQEQMRSASHVFAFVFCFVLVLFLTQWKQRC